MYHISEHLHIPTPRAPGLGACETSEHRTHYIEEETSLRKSLCEGVLLSRLTRLQKWAGAQCKALSPDVAHLCSRTGATLPIEQMKKQAQNQLGDLSKAMQTTEFLAPRLSYYKLPKTVWSPIGISFPSTSSSPLS